MAAAAEAEEMIAEAEEAAEEAIGEAAAASQLALDRLGMAGEDRCGLLLRQRERERRREHRRALELEDDLEDARDECVGLRKAVKFARNFIETEKMDGNVMKTMVSSYREEIAVLREQNTRMQAALEQAFKRYDLRRDEPLCVRQADAHRSDHRAAPVACDSVVLEFLCDATAQSRSDRLHSHL